MPKKRINKKKKADQLFSLYIRGRDKACIRCATTEDLQCAHIITRGYHAVRWDEDNAIALCRSDHVFFTHRPLEWENFIDNRFPGRRDELRKKALTYEKQDLDAIIKRFIAMGSST